MLTTTPIDSKNIQKKTQRIHTYRTLQSTSAKIHAFSGGINSTSHSLTTLHNTPKILAYGDCNKISQESIAIAYCTIPYLHFHTQKRQYKVAQHSMCIVLMYSFCKFLRQQLLNTDYCTIYRAYNVQRLLPYSLLLLKQSYPVYTNSCSNCVSKTLLFLLNVCMFPLSFNNAH